MENATHALLIAGGILFALLTLTLFVYMFCVYVVFIFWFIKKSCRFTFFCNVLLKKLSYIVKAP